MQSLWRLLRYAVAIHYLPLTHEIPDRSRHGQRYFHRYCELGSVRLLKEDLDLDGLRSKLRITSNGVPLR
jgi:hypothetical protein